MRFLAIVAVAVGVFASNASYGDCVVRVMSFNIRYGLAMDKENAWNFRQGVLLQMLKAYEPDVIGTQECLEFQAKFIAAALPEYDWFGVGRDEGGKGEMTAVFFKKDALVPEETRYFWLSETPEVQGSRSWKTACTRMVSVARFRHLKTGDRFNYYNTHLDHASELAREEGAKLILKRIQAEPDLPAILTGDFNANAERSTPWDILTQGGLHDAWVECNKKKGPEQTFGGYKAPVPDSRYQRIDWILYTGALAPESIETVTFNLNGHYPSDHYPVYTVLRMGNVLSNKIK